MSSGVRPVGFLRFPGDESDGAVDVGQLVFDESFIFVDDALDVSSGDDHAVGKRLDGLPLGFFEAGDERGEIWLTGKFIGEGARSMGGFVVDCGHVRHECVELGLELFDALDLPHGEGAGLLMERAEESFGGAEPVPPEFFEFFGPFRHDDQGMFWEVLAAVWADGGCATEFCRASSPTA